MTESSDGNILSHGVTYLQAGLAAGCAGLSFCGKIFPGPQFLKVCGVIRESEMWENQNHLGAIGVLWDL